MQRVLLTDLSPKPCSRRHHSGWFSHFIGHRGRTGMCLFKSTQQDAPVSPHSFLFSSLTDAKQKGSQGRARGAQRKREKRGGGHSQKPSSASPPHRHTHTHTAGLSQEKWGTHNLRSNDHDWEERQDTIRFLIYHFKSVLLNDSMVSTLFQPTSSGVQLLSKYRDHVCIVWHWGLKEFLFYSSRHTYTHTNSPAWLRLGKYTHSIKAIDQEGY